jgi:hypothetical protein
LAQELHRELSHQEIGKSNHLHHLAASCKKDAKPVDSATHYSTSK